jgi:ubiquinone/menaquinone biosynthesis C-methylase UbiE
MKNKRFSGKTGEEYELFKLGCPHFEKLEKKVGEVIKKKFKNKKLKEINAVEIGCGPGYTTLIILNSDKRLKIISIDNEKVMINQAKIILKDLIKKDRVKLIHEDALKYLKKQKDNSFDVFASGFTLHNFSDKYRRKVLIEIYRVLRQEGIFVNADKYALDNKREHRESLKWQLNQFKKEYSKIKREDLTREWSKHYLEDERKDILMKELDSIKFMNKIGFKNTKIMLRKKMDAVLFAVKK